MLGMASAMTSELLYLVPVVCLLTIAARGWLSRLAVGDIVRSSAFSRLIVLSTGFLAVFVPSRLAIAAECSRGECYEGSAASLSSLAVEQWLGRAVAPLQLETLSTTLAGEYDNLSSTRDPDRLRDQCLAGSCRPVAGVLRSRCLRSGCRERPSPLIAFPPGTCAGSVQCCVDSGAFSPWRRLCW